MFPFFPSLNVIHIYNNFLCLILMGMKTVYVIMCYSLFALKMKHNVKVVR